MDPFEQAVYDAKARLSAREGSEVSWREIIRRAGVEDTKSSQVLYHLRPRPKGRAKGQHTVPLYIVDAMAQVLPISRQELMTAAAQAAGYDVPRVVDPNVYTAMITRVLHDESTSQDERDRIAREVLATIERVMPGLRTQAGEPRE